GGGVGGGSVEGGGGLAGSGREGGQGEHWRFLTGGAGVPLAAWHSGAKPPAAGRSGEGESNDFTDRVFQDGLEDIPALTLLAAGQGLGEVPGLAHGDVARPRRLGGVDRRPHPRPPPPREGLPPGIPPLAPGL